VVSRSGWAGVQRWAWLWTGDVESSWAGLAQQIPTVVGLGVSGVPFCGPDIGGFNGVPSPELFVRWLELSVLLPYCRTHAVVGAPPREPWRFAEPFHGHIGRLIKLRYHLLPYLYTLAHEAHVFGHPLVRPLSWPLEGEPPPASAGLGSLDDAFLLGPAVLAAPVVAPKTDRRSVTLPAGTWLPFAPLHGDTVGHEALEGPGTVALAAPLGQPPMAVRAGSIVPLDDAWLAQGEAARLPYDHRALQPTLHCWPDRRGRATGQWYDDAGDGDGPGRRESLSLGPGRRRGELVLRRRSAGGFPPPERLGIVLHGRRVQGATVEGQDASVSETVSGSRVACPGGAAEVRLVVSEER
jgi:alpha-glucosidase